MSNMSYCRFQNTERDLRDCADALEELRDDPTDAERLSAEELAAAKRLVDECVRILQIVTEEVGVEVEEFFDDSAQGMERHIALALNSINK